MRILGVIAEYDPFHSGHARHLREARRLSGADAVVAVMSCAFTQRGAPAMLPPTDRARMALNCGADAVIALPALWSLRDAEHFALGGVSLLRDLGCGCISFGTENDSLPVLRRAARLLESPPDDVRESLRSLLKEGLPYPTAMSRAIGAADVDAARCLLQPNSILAVSYLRAMLRLNADLEVFPVIREGSYHASVLDEGTFPSASAIRNAVFNGNLNAVKKAMPQPAADILEQCLLDRHVCRPGCLDQALLYRLKTMTDAEYASLPGLSEGLDDRLRNAVRQSGTTAELRGLLASRRYPAPRLNRLCAHALLQITQGQIEQTPLPPAALLLGFRQDADALIGCLSKGQVPLLSRAAEAPVGNDWFRVEQRAWDLQAMAMGMPSGSIMTRKLIKV